MNVDIQLVPSILGLDTLSNKTVVVIDVLRLTSVIVYAFTQGVKEIIPVEEVEEAFQKIKDFPPDSTFLGGERENRRIEGFEFGNSPLEYSSERVKGKRLILTTTNGTRAFQYVSSAKEVMVGSFLNISSTVKRCIDLKQDVLIFLSGDQGRFSLEDTICGGMLIENIIKNSCHHVTLTDASYCSLFLFQRFESNLLGAFHLSKHGKELFEMGASEDLIFCAQTDIATVIPVYRNGVIRLF